MLSVPTKAFISKVFSNHDFLSGTPFGTPLFEVYHHTYAMPAPIQPIQLEAFIQASRNIHPDGMS